VHIGFDLFLNWLRGTMKEWVEVANYVIIMIFAVLVFVFGIILFLSVKDTVTGGLGLPLGYVYSAVPMGFFVMILFVAESLWSEIRKKKNPTDLPG
jgi:TRAP-type C4-dicarboxylate transport system permease small subunit